MQSSKLFVLEILTLLQLKKQIMKLFRLFLILLATNFLFTACEKDTSFEAGIARGTIVKDAAGDCLNFNPIGVYQTNTILNTTNYIDVQIIMSEAGSYLVSTDTLNGYSFSDTGIAVVGLNVLRLKAHGKPITAGINTFTVKFDGSTCSFDVSVGNGPATTVAAFTFVGAPATCAGALPNTAAIFMQGITTNPTNWVDVNVIVTNPGTYSINTGTTAINGVKYSGSGSLAIGNQTIRLIADGSTPTAAGTFNYPLSVSGSNCGFDVVYQSMVGPSSFTFDCASASIPVGNYFLGVTLDPILDTMTINVNVITTGTYTITTSPTTGGPDGVTFSAAGLFSSTGLKTITLRGNGTPIRPAIVFYNITSPQATNTTPCNAAVYYDFLQISIDGSALRNFSFNSGATNDNSTVPGYKLIAMGGDAAFTGNESIYLAIGVPTASTFPIPPPTSIYSVNDFTKYAGADYTDASLPSIDYLTFPMPPTIQTTPLTISISFLSASRIEGSFTGNVKDNSGVGPGVKLISGSFGLKIQ